jgi:hypothetical protein
MSSMNRDLARAMVEQRRWSADQRRLAAPAGDVRRRARRGRHAVRRRRSPGPSVRRLRRRLATLWLVQPPSRRRPDEEVRAELDGILRRVAESVVECGTVNERRVLALLATAASQASPGAAAALVDWDGAEIARLRAFGIVHGVVLDTLHRSDRLWLLHQILGTAELRLAG